MIGGTKDEAAIFLAPDDAVWNRTVTEDELRKRIAAVAGDAADSLLAYYKRRDPAASPSDSADHGAHRVELRRALGACWRSARPQRGKAPVWMYSFDWETPAFGGRLKSPHSDRRAVRLRYARRDRRGAPQAQRAGAGRPRIEDLGHALRATAIPATTSIPAWPAYSRRPARHDAVRRSSARSSDDPDGEVRPLWSMIATSLTGGLIAQAAQAVGIPPGSLEGQAPGMGATSW